jgi:hypothetical protein
VNKMIRYEPYIGITGFMSRQEVEAVVSSLENKDDKRWLMVGVLASEKSFAGIPNKFPNRYPAPQTIKDIFPEDSSMLRLIHFSTRAKGMDLLNQLYRLREMAGENCDGFQLNIKWPPLKILSAYQALFPHDTLVLQCGGGAMKSVGYNPQKLTDRIAEYQYHARYVLIDASGGYGKALDAVFMGEVLHALSSKFIPTGPVIAGGLTGDTLEMIRSIVGEFPDVSIDAEGGLRDSEDHLDLGKVEKYVNRALKLFAR